MKLKQVIICFREQKEMEKTETEVGAIYTLFLYHEKFSHSVVADSLRAHALQQEKPPQRETRETRTSQLEKAGAAINTQCGQK